MPRSPRRQTNKKLIFCPVNTTIVSVVMVDFYCHRASTSAFTRNLPYIVSILFTRVKFTCDYALQKSRDSENPTLRWLDRVFQGQYLSSFLSWQKSSTFYKASHERMSRPQQNLRGMLLTFYIVWNITGHYSKSIQLQMAILLLKLIIIHKFHNLTKASRAWILSSIVS